MQVTLIGIIMIGLWLAIASRGVSAAAFYTLLLLPFGMAATLSVGGLSLIGVQAGCILTVGYAIAHHIFRGGEISARLSTPGMILVTYCLWGAVTAFIMPRLFYHELNVIPLPLDPGGLRVSELFTNTTLHPLEPRSTNISQPLYLIINTSFFLVLAWVARMRGVMFIHNALRLAAVINLVLGLLDAAGLQAFMEIFRTADYALADSQRISDIRRMIGGFSEPSSLGAFSTALAAYFGSAFLDRRRVLDGLAFLAAVIPAVATLSSGAIASLGVMTIFLVARAIYDFLRRGDATPVVLSAVAGATLTGLLTAGLMITTPLGPFVLELLDALVFSKGESLSGQERGFWAAAGLRAFVETYGLGAGLGSVRANGLFAVVLANVGVIGLALHMAFIWAAFLRVTPRPARPKPADRRARMVLRAGVSGGLIILFSKTLSATTLDPGVLMLAFAASVIEARRRLRSASLAAIAPQHVHHPPWRRPAPAHYRRPA